jgi:predicted small metal-binding protein
MAKELRCGDVMPGCTFVASGATEEEVLKKAAQHAKDKHNVKELTADLVGKVKAAIRTK